LALSSKPAGARFARPSACNKGLFRSDVGVAAGAAGRWNHRRVAGVRRRRADFRINAGGRTQYAVGFCQFVAERLSPLPGGGAFGHDHAARRHRLHRRAIIGRSRRRGLGRWRRRYRWGLRTGAAGGCDQRVREKGYVFRSHAGQRPARAEVPQRMEGFQALR
jgi:hypothetical protein